MISDLNKRKYLRILTELKAKNAFTQQEIAVYLSVSERKVNSFMRGKIYDFWMMSQFAGLLGFNLVFNLEQF